MFGKKQQSTRRKSQTIYPQFDIHRNNIVLTKKKRHELVHQQHLDMGNWILFEEKAARLWQFGKRRTLSAYMVKLVGITKRLADTYLKVS